tara:strand:- start:710 stop:2467 length:1758 start_codon:yes stop_codon:yes gene_type:complete
MATYIADAIWGDISFPAAGGAGARDYPIYTCMISASQLDLMADVPRFSSTIDHHDLSAKLVNVPGAPPSTDWQRPMVSDKLDLIVESANKSVPHERVFPNPVLLGVNYTEIGRARGANFTANHQDNLSNGLELFELEIEYDETRPIDVERGKPLVIIDGQHRVIGLARSNQRDQFIPCVILAHPDLFSMSVMARIFSEVSTTATKLDEMHQEWMEYAFSMGSHYTTGRRHADQWRDAMKTVVLLNSEATFDDGRTARPAPPAAYHPSTSANHLRGAVKFNPHENAPNYGYHHVRYESDELAAIIKKEYYGKTPATRLDAEDLKTCIARAFFTLENVDSKRAAGGAGGSKIFDSTTADSSVQLGVGVMIGICHFIAGHADPMSLTINQWNTLWRNANLHRFDWGLTHADLRGPMGSGESGKKAAKFVVSSMIRKALEGHASFTAARGHTNLRDHLRGNNSTIKLEAIFDGVPGGAAHSQTTIATPTSGALRFQTINMQAGKPVALGGSDRHKLKFTTSDDCLKVGHDFSNTANPANTDQRKILMKAFGVNGVNLDGQLPRGTYEFEIITQSYTQGTKKRTRVKVVY